VHIAIPIHRGRISPLFDAARAAVVVEIANGRVASRLRIVLDGGRAQDRIEAIVRAGADGVVCGAVSDEVLDGLLRCGLLVWPAVAGGVEEVIESLVTTGTLDDRFMMPGSGRLFADARSRSTVDHWRGPWSWSSPGGGESR
jgi:predicted Fe-Mo cluster-binding NifX family protein